MGLFFEILDLSEHKELHNAILQIIKMYLNEFEFQVSFFFHITHDSQCCSLDKFAFNTFQDLQFSSIQLTAVNGAVP